MSGDILPASISPTVITLYRKHAPEAICIKVKSLTEPEAKLPRGLPVGDGMVVAFTSPVLLGLVQPLHGLTFALLHLACMRLIVQVVPVRLAATAQSIYGTCA